MDEAGARAAVEHALGVAPLELRPQPFGHHSVTFEAVLPDRSVMVRMHRDPDAFAGTAANLRILGGLGVPVPAVVAEDRSLERLPFAIVILERIPGTDLRYQLGDMTNEQVAVLARQVVETQRRVQQLPPGGGFGWVPIGTRGPFQTWWELLRHGWDARIAGRPGKIVDPLEAVLEANHAELSAQPPLCFLDDITGKNVIVEDGELRGMVDFDVVCYGDPLFWTGLTATGIVCDLGFRDLRYVEALLAAWGANRAERRRVSLYAAYHALDFLGRMTGTEDREANDRLIEAAARWLSHPDSFAV